MPFISAAWARVYDFFDFIFREDFSTRWKYDRLSIEDWEPSLFVRFFIWSGEDFALTYPIETAGYAERDAENWVRFVGVVDNLFPIVQFALGQFLGARIDVFLKRVVGLDDRFVVRLDVWGTNLSGEDEIFGQVISLPFWVVVGAQVGQKQFFAYKPWQIESGMDELSRQAIFEIRDGLRPWTYGNLTVPVPNDGQPGFLEMHRQLTDSEDLGVYYEPTLRELIGSTGCGFDVVFVTVSVRGDRFESRDLILPLPTDDQWEYNHFGQLRVARFRNGRFDCISHWKWIRSRDYTEVFFLPKKDSETEGSSYAYLPFAQWYGGLTVTVAIRE